MKKAQLPLLAELDLGTTKKSISNRSRKFAGTRNPRQLRVLHALLIRARKREEIDRIAGASNGPELIAALRRRGLEIPCAKVPTIDRDGLLVKCGVYYLTYDDRRNINARLVERYRGSAC